MLRGWGDAQAGIQFVESAGLDPAVGHHATPSASTASPLWLVLLTTFLTPLILLLPPGTSSHKHPKEYVIAFLK